MAPLRSTLVLILLLLAGPALAEPGRLCRAAIQAAERAAGIPAHLLTAIGRVESGRRDPETGAFHPWPWTINAEGRGQFFPTKAAAIAEVRALQARGVRSIDVGCMQVNLRHHPDAFPDLDAAFDPPRNVAYAAAFLRELHRRTGSWAEAVAQYHSGEPGRGLAYHSRVVVARLAGGTMLAAPATLRGLCAPGRQPAVLVARNGRPRMTCRG